MTNPRDEAAERYATGNHRASFPDTREMEAFKAGWDAAIEEARRTASEHLTRCFPLASSAQREDGAQEIIFDGKVRQVVLEIRDGDIDYVWWKNRITQRYNDWGEDPAPKPGGDGERGSG